METISVPPKIDSTIPPEVIDLRDGATAARPPEVLDKIRDLLDPPITITDAEGNDRQYGYANFEYAQDSGLLDIFNYDPKDGDAVLHILQGDVTARGDEAIPEIAGYHLESAARHPQTRVITDLDAMSGKRRRKFKRWPFEPYKAKVMIEGFPKVVLHQNEETGKVEGASSDSSMFPEQYDALSVLQAIRIARETRDPAQDQTGRNNTLVAVGYAPMLDGETLMPIRLIMNSKDQKVLAAMPLVDRKGRMQLLPRDIRRHLGLLDDAKNGINKP